MWSNHVTSAFQLCRHPGVAYERVKLESRVPNSHFLCNVMLLNERFARPRADLHHRSKCKWSCVHPQGRDSPRSFSVTVSRAYVPPSAESSEDTFFSGSSSAASFLGVVPRGQWAHLNQLRLALIDRSAKLVEPLLVLASHLRLRTHSSWLMLLDGPGPCHFIGTFAFELMARNLLHS